MPFIEEILKYKSLSIVGLEKNTGKTECLNYILRRLNGSGHRIAVTSIGVDGETTDRVTGTSKPETALYDNVIFITSEKHYHQKKLISEVLDISNRKTALGRLVTARALSKGSVMISGPGDTFWMQQLIGSMNAYEVDLTIVDGAVSRLSPASPAITESMILNTGAAVSVNIDKLVSQTKFTFELINLPVFEYNNSNLQSMLSVNQGMYSIDGDGNISDLGIDSVFMLKDSEVKLKDSKVLYASGAISDRLLEVLRQQGSEITLIVRDFTRLFIKPETYRAFINRGNQLKVLLKSKLLAVCANPVSPAGYVLNSDELCNRLSSELNLPVYDIMKQKG